MPSALWTPKRQGVSGLAVWWLAQGEKVCEQNHENVPCHIWRSKFITFDLFTPYANCRWESWLLCKECFLRARCFTHIMSHNSPDKMLLAPSYKLGRRGVKLAKGKWPSQGFKPNSGSLQVGCFYSQNVSIFSKLSIPKWSIGTEKTLLTRKRCLYIVVWYFGATDISGFYNFGSRLACTHSMTVALSSEISSCL